MSEINDVDDLLGMLPDEIVAVVQRLEAENQRLRAGLEAICDDAGGYEMIPEDKIRALLAGEPRASAAGSSGDAEATRCAVMTPT